MQAISRHQNIIITVTWKWLILTYTGKQPPNCSVFRKLIMLKSRITGFVIMDASAEGHRTMDSCDQGKNTLCKHIKDTNNQSGNAPAIWTRQTHPSTCAAQSGTIWASHTSVQRMGWSAVFPVQRGKHPGPALNHPMFFLASRECRSWKRTHHCSVHT